MSVTLLFFVVFAVKTYNISGGVVGSDYIPSGEVPSGDESCMVFMEHSPYNILYCSNVSDYYSLQICS